MPDMARCAVTLNTILGAAAIDATDGASNASNAAKQKRNLMRTAGDRIRHAVSFEIIGLILVTPLGTWVFGTPLHDMGVVTVVSATIATCWNYVYNLAFDHAMLRMRGDVHKTVHIRVFHAILFEAGLLVMLPPFIALYLGTTLIGAFGMGVSFAAFYVIYAFTFNWAYDVIYPVPPPKRKTAANAD